MDRACATDIGGFAFSEPRSRLTPSVDAKNLRAVQLLLGHAKLESTVRYLGIEVNDALEMAEQTEV